MAPPLTRFHGPEPRLRRTALLFFALVVSLGVHGGLTLSGLVSPSAISVAPITVSLLQPTPPLPPAEELAPSLAEDDVGGPESDADPAPAVDDADPSPEVEDLDEPEATDNVEEAAPPPVDDRAVRLAELQAARDARLAERLALSEKRKAAREARRAARRKALEAAGAKRGGAPDPPSQQGDPDAVFLCDKDGLVTDVRVLSQQPLTAWIPVVPTAFAYLQTRPSMSKYVGDLLHIRKRQPIQGIKRVGIVELAAPQEVLQIELDQPRGVTIALGRIEGRCLIGFKYSPKLFPFSLHRVPARIIDKNNNTVTALVDFSIFKDASFEIRAVDGTPLPFGKGMLKNHARIAQNIEDHYQAARFAKSMADAFGIQLGPKRTGPAKDKKAAASGR